MENYEVGDKIYFAEEKRPYTIMACSHRYLICTKPFNLQHTVLYTIVDFSRNIRGTENLVLDMGFETIEECEKALHRLMYRKTEVSSRNCIKLNIIKK